MKVEYFGGAAYFPETGVCAVADVHIGMEAAIQAEGFAMPLDEEKELLGRFKAVVQRFSPKVMVLDGDVLHEFHRVRRNTQKNFDRVMLALIASVDEVVVILGSHDKMMGVALTDIDGVSSEPFYFAGGVLYCHGDVLRAKRKTGAQLSANCKPIPVPSI